MKISYDNNTNKFLFQVNWDENAVVAGLPERRFRKRTAVWAAPALQQNLAYMQQYINKREYFDDEAWQVFQKRTKEIEAPIQKGSGFPAWYKFKNPPLSYQKKALNKFFPLDCAGILFEQGLGKTYTSINLATSWRMTDQIDSLVVICPSSIKLVWEDEMHEHCPIPYDYHVITGNYKKTQKFIEEKTDFQCLVVGIEGLSQGKASDYVFKFLRTRRCGIIIDESSGIKTPNKIRTDKCIDMGKEASKRVILSGTHITEGIENWYTQLKFLSPDITGFDSFYSFRAHYCHLIQLEVGYDPVTGMSRKVPKIVGYKNEDELVKRVAPYVTRVEKKDVLPELPDKIFTNRYVSMTKEQKRLYDNMKLEMVVEFDGVDEEYIVKTKLEQRLRLQQITGGHYPWDIGDTKVIPQRIPGKNPKLQELMSILDEISGKVVVWCQFRPEIALVAEALEKADIGYVEFHGGCNSDEKSHAVHNFRTDDRVKVFLATRAAARGLTLIESSNSVYYSQGYSFETYAQSTDRIHRIGQKDSCNYIHLLCEKTVDLEVIDALQQKGAMAQLINDMVKAEEKRLEELTDSPDCDII